MLQRAGLDLDGHGPPRTRPLMSGRQFGDTASGRALDHALDFHNGRPGGLRPPRQPPGSRACRPHAAAPSPLSVPRRRRWFVRLRWRPAFRPPRAGSLQRAAARRRAVVAARLAGMHGRVLASCSRPAPGKAIASRRCAEGGEDRLRMACMRARSLPDPSLIRPSLRRSVHRHPVPSVITGRAYSPSRDNPRLQMRSCFHVRSPERRRDDFPRRRQVAQLRVPPHSIEAESSVLGGLLLDNGAWDRVGDLLTDGDFYRYEHQLIFGAIGTLINGSKPADVITVYEHLQIAGQGRGHRRPGLPELAGAVRAQRRQHPPLRGDRARALHPAQADRASDEIATAGLQHARQGGRADPGRGRAEDLQHRRRRLARRSRASRAWTSWRAADRPRPGDGGQPERHHRRAHRLLRPRPHDLRPAGRRPDRPGGASLDGQDGVGHQHRRARRAERRPARRRVLDGNGRRRSSRCVSSARSAASTSAPAHRQADRRRVAAPDRGHREAAQHLSCTSTRRPASRSANCAPTRGAWRASAAQAGPDRGRLPAAHEHVDAA